MTGLLELTILQGHSLGPFQLGASIHDVLARIKAQQHRYGAISVSYSQSHPISTPILVTLVQCGLRFRFDGQEQRLRLIELMDFGKVQLKYKENDIGNARKIATDEFGLAQGDAAHAGPEFRTVYKIFGPTTPGEYIAPPKEPRQKGSKAKKIEKKGTYVLSYPGVAFSFPLPVDVWKPEIQWGKMSNILSSSVTGAATALSIFQGDSWEAARNSLYTSDVSDFHRSPIPQGVRKENVPKEMEHARIHDHGRVELVRKDAPSFWIVMGETTPQDLVTELGPPDQVHRKNDRRVSIHRARKGSSAGHSRRGSANSDLTPPNPNKILGLQNEFEENSQTDSIESDTEDEDDVIATEEKVESEQVFYCYYSHGFDILISYPTQPSDRIAGTEDASRHDSPPPDADNPILPRNHLTVTKITIHGNVPGSWAFNRHRRLRWVLASVHDDDDASLTSETPWSVLQPRLQSAFHHLYPTEEDARQGSLPMVLNRGWGREELPEDWSTVGTFEEGGMRKKGGGISDSKNSEEERMGEAELYGFPGLIFEVIKNGAVCGLMVY